MPAVNPADLPKWSMPVLAFMKNVISNFKIPLAVIGTSIVTTVLTFLLCFLFALLMLLLQPYGLDVFTTKISVLILLAIIWVSVTFIGGLVVSKFIAQADGSKFRVYSFILSALFTIGIAIYLSSFLTVSHLPGGSFVQGTKVFTPGGLQSIENLKVGDQVIGYDDKADTYVISTVQKYRARTTNDFYQINDTLGVTSEHPIAVRDRDKSLIWKRVRELRVGERMIGYGGGGVEIYNLEKTRPPVPVSVYNPQTSFPHNYFVVVGDTLILVHNKI